MKSKECENRLTVMAWKLTEGKSKSYPVYKALLVREMERRNFTYKSDPVCERVPLGVGTEKMFWLLYNWRLLLHIIICLYCNDWHVILERH